MNPNQQQGKFTQQHHDIFNGIRDLLMNLHTQGIPGMDELLGQLNKTHTRLLSPMAQQPVQKQPMQQKPMQQPMTSQQGALAQDIGSQLGQGAQQAFAGGAPQAYINKQKGMVR